MGQPLGSVSNHKTVHKCIWGLPDTAWLLSQHLGLGRGSYAWDGYLRLKIVGRGVGLEWSKQPKETTQTTFISTNIIPDIFRGV